MKRIVFLWLLLAVSATSFGQSGLSQGQAYVNPSANPGTTYKTCDHCGIRMGNITYPWQHETWCPYYRPKNSGSGGSTISLGKSTTNAMTALATAAAGELISNAITNWLDPGKGDNNRYDNTNFGGKVKFYTSSQREDDHTCVVLSDRSTGKLGIWHNAYVFYSASPNSPSHMQVSGFWVIRPQYDKIYMSLFDDTHPYAICGAESRDKKGNEQWKWNVYEFGLGSYCNKGHCALISEIEGTDIHFNLSSNTVAMANQDGRWGVWKVGRPPMDKLKKARLWLNESVPPQYDSVTVWSNCVDIWKGGRAGMIDENGKEIIPAEYYKIGTIVGPNRWAYAQKEKNGDFGVINDRNQVCVPFEYDAISVNAEGVGVGADGRFGAYFKDGSKTGLIWTEMPVFNKDGYIFKVESGYGYKAFKNNTELKPEFESITFEEVKDTKYLANLVAPKVSKKKVIAAKKGGLWGVYAMNGDEVISPLIVKRDRVGYFISSLPFTSFRYRWKDKADELSSTRGEFETQADFEARNTDPKLKEAYLQKARKQFEREFMTERIRKAVSQKDGLSLDWGNYDMDSQSFPFACSVSPIPLYEIAVPLTDAPTFKETVKTARPTDLLRTMSFFIYKDFVTVAEFTVTLPSGKVFHYRNPGLDDMKNRTGDTIVKYTDLY